MREEKRKRKKRSRTKYVRKGEWGGVKGERKREGRKRGGYLERKGGRECEEEGKQGEK